MDQGIVAVPRGSEDFRMVEIKLSPGATVQVEPGAMASMDSGISIETKLNGSLLTALIRKFLGGESFFINRFYNQTENAKSFFVTKSQPGEILSKTLSDELWYIERGSYIASTKGVRKRIVWAGFASWFAGEGLFRMALSGSGTFWYGCFGAVVDKEVEGSWIVDSGHLLSYSPGIKLHIRLAGSLFSSLVSKEGFVLELSGKGQVQLQTRSLKGLAGWLNARFW